MLLLLFLLLSILSQTGAGKTHTMIGTAADPGVMVLAFRDLFEKAGQHAEEHRVKHNVLVSFLEIYNENIFDLLVSFALVLYLVEILFLSFDRISSHYISFLCARVLFFFPNYRTHLSLNHLILSTPDATTSGSGKEERRARDSFGMEVLVLSCHRRKRLRFAGRSSERPLREWHHRNGRQQRRRSAELVGKWQFAAAPGIRYCFIFSFFTMNCEAQRRQKKRIEPLSHTRGHNFHRSFTFSSLFDYQPALNQAATSANAESSRSHAVFQITVETRDHAGADDDVKCVYYISTGT